MCQTCAWPAAPVKLSRNRIKHANAPEG